MTIPERAGQKHNRHDERMYRVGHAGDKRQHYLARDEEVQGGDEQPQVDRCLDPATQVEVLNANDAENG